MTDWLLTHIPVALAIASLGGLALVGAYIGMDFLRDHLDARKAADDTVSGAPEGGNPTVGMPRFR
jgi:hypothetical protein